MPSNSGGVHTDWQKAGTGRYAEGIMDGVNNRYLTSYNIQNIWKIKQSSNITFNYEGLDGLKGYLWGILFLFIHYVIVACECLGCMEWVFGLEINRYKKNKEINAEILHQK